MEWLQKDCATGTDADMIVHMGDHAYNEGDEDERRADAYMAGYQPVLSQCPWLPIVGNHEFFETQISRYLNSTWQGWGPIPGGDVPGSRAGAGAGASAGASTSASTSKEGQRVDHHQSRISSDDHNGKSSSALGSLLSIGNHHAAGTHGSTPSHSSRYFSTDFGLVHLIALDFNLYYGEDPCGEPCKQAQLKWFEQDLAAANKNRDAVPWVFAMAHFPVFCTGCGANFVSAAYYASDDAEYYGNCNITAGAAFDAAAAAASAHAHLGSGAQNRSSSEDPQQSQRLGGASDNLISDFAPLLEQYGVDVFIAGHWHYYESLWPGKTGTDTCKVCLQPLAKDFNNPRGTVHITSGNGGPPGKDNFREHCPGSDCGSIPATRKQTTDYGYGRIVVHNASVLEFTQYQNADQSVFDHFVVTQNNHGPFV
jgi:hypothetical protein